MKKTTFLALFILGLALRLFLAISTYHQDLGAITLSSSYILSGQALNFYEQSGQDISKTIFNYQPLAYLLPSFFYLPFANHTKSAGETYLNSDWQKGHNSFFNFDLLLFKYPHLLADFLIFLLLGSILIGYKNKQSLQLLWWLNPVSIFVSSVIGQVDIFITLFLLIAYYFQQKGKLLPSIFFISLSALIKPIGLVLLPFVIWSKSKNIFPKTISSITSLSLGVVFYLLGILPYLWSESYRYYALFADQINKTIYSGIEVSPGTVIPFFFISLFFIYFLYLHNKLSYLKVICLVLLSSLVFTNFHPQWLVWVMPFLVMLPNSSLLVPVISLSWLLVLFSFDSTLHLGSFINSRPTFFQEIISSNFFKQLTLMGRSALVATLLWIFKDHEEV